MQHPALPPSSPEAADPRSLAQESLLKSLVFAGAVVGQLVMGYAGDAIGRRRAMALTNLLTALQQGQTTVVALCAARLAAYGTRRPRARARRPARAPGLRCGEAPEQSLGGLRPTAQPWSRARVARAKRRSPGVYSSRSESPSEAPASVGLAVHVLGLIIIRTIYSVLPGHWRARFSAAHVGRRCLLKAASQLSSATAQQPEPPRTGPADCRVVGPLTRERSAFRWQQQASAQGDLHEHPRRSGRPEWRPVGLLGRPSVHAKARESALCKLQATPPPSTRC